VHQLNVKNAFLHGTHTKVVYCTQHTQLNKSFYGMKQVSWASYHCFASYLVSLGFLEAKSNTSLFVYRRGTDTTYLLMYVNDTILTTLSPEFLQHTTTSIQREFTMKDLGPCHHFLNIFVAQRHDNFMHQHQAQDILQHTGISDCKPCTTLVDNQAKLSSDTAPLSATWLPTTV
jgi:hypothetical protein